MKDAEEKAREIMRAWQTNPGMAGEPDLQERIARSLREAHAAGRRAALVEACLLASHASEGFAAMGDAGAARGAGQVWQDIRALVDRDAGGGE